MPGHPVISCTNSHILRWVSQVSFICNLCNHKYKQERFNCRKCEFNICSQCSFILEEIFIKKLYKKDARGHDLAYAPFASDQSILSKAKCKNCNLQYMSKGF